MGYSRTAQVSSWLTLLVVSRAGYSTNTIPEAVLPRLRAFGSSTENPPGGKLVAGVISSPLGKKLQAEDNEASQDG
jgi:hypothetical protein